MKFKDKYTSFQVGAQRLQQALRGNPGYVPVYAQMHEHVIHELNLNHREFYTRPDLLVPASLEIAERYGMDAGFVDYDVYNIEAEALGQAMLYSDDRIPEVDHTAALIQSPDDLRKITTPDFGSAGRFAQIIEMHRIYSRLTSLPSALQFCAPFSLAATLRGIETFIKDILRTPDFARALLDVLTDKIIIPWIAYQKAHFPNFTGIAGADAMASIPIVNLKMLAEWVVPYILRVRERCGMHVYVPNWVGERHLKNPKEMMALKLLVCPNFLEGQDPDVAELGPEIFKSHAEEHQRPLVLGLGANFMESATPEEVRQRTQYYLEVGTRNSSGFALYLCNLSAATPPENIHTAVETAHGWNYAH